MTQSTLQTSHVCFRSGWNYILGNEPTVSEPELSLVPATTETMCGVSAWGLVPWATGLC